MNVKSFRDAAQPGNDANRHLSALDFPFDRLFQFGRSAEPGDAAAGRERARPEPVARKNMPMIQFCLILPRIALRPRALSRRARPLFHEKRTLSFLCYRQHGFREPHPCNGHLDPVGSAGGAGWACVLLPRRHRANRRMGLDGRKQHSAMQRQHLRSARRIRRVGYSRLREHSRKSRRRPNLVRQQRPSMALWGLWLRCQRNSWRTQRSVGVHSIHERMGVDGR